MTDQFNNDPSNLNGRKPPANQMASASFTCSLLALITFWFIFLSMIFAALAIVLGMLSRGSAKKTVKPAGAAVRIAAIALIVTSLYTAFSVNAVIRQSGGWDKFINSYKNAVEKSINTESDGNGSSATDSGNNYF